MYARISLQVFRRKNPLLLKGNVCGSSVPQAGRTCGRTSSISRGMIIVSMGGDLRDLQNALPRRFSLAWRRTFHILSLLLNLTNLGLTLLILVLFAAGMLPSGNTVVFKLQKLTQIIFHPGIEQKLFFEILKTLFSVENSIIFLALLFEKNVNSNFASFSFPPLVSSDGSTAVLPSFKAELFVQTFASNSTLDDSGAIPPLSTPSNSFMPKTVISSKDVISALSFNTKKAYG